jgi:hypothetical protein
LFGFNAPAFIPSFCKHYILPPRASNFAGVKPQLKELYQEGVFKCLVGGTAVELQRSTINDDFCDCDDGRGKRRIF